MTVSAAEDADSIVETATLQLATQPASGKGCKVLTVNKSSSDVRNESNVTVLEVENDPGLTGSVTATPSSVTVGGDINRDIHGDADDKSVG